jgi:hypothetical protein
MGQNRKKTFNAMASMQCNASSRAQLASSPLPECFKFPSGTFRFVKSQRAVIRGELEESDGLLLGALPQRQLSAVEIRFADLAFLPIGVGIVRRGQRRCWRQLPQEQADDRCRPSCHIDL